MGIKRSEYRHAYVKTPDKELKHDFEKNLDYRILRRQVEHEHTPFEWDYFSEDDEEQQFYEDYLKANRMKAREEKKRQERAKEFLKSHQMKKDEEERRHQEYAREFLEDYGNLRSSREERSRRVAKEARGDEERKERRDRNEDNEKQYEADGEHERRCEKCKKVHKKDSAQKSRTKRPKKPGYPLPKPAPLEASNKRRQRQAAAVVDHPGPFVPYGLGDKERETGALRTYNVRSSADIYPSALRARKRLEPHVDRHEAHQRCWPLREPRSHTRPSTAPHSESRPDVHRDQFNERMTRQTTGWDSEYKNRFVGYEPGEYKRCNVPGGARFYVPL